MKIKHLILLAVAAFAGLPPQGKAQLALGTATTFAVLGGSTVTSTGSTFVNGDLGVSPGTAISGFLPGGLGVVNGTTHNDDPVAAQARADAFIAYNSLAGESYLPANDLTGQDLGGRTLTPGVYFFSSSAQLTGQLTLDGQGDPNARFDFRIGSTLGTATSSSVRLIGSAQAANVFWQVVSSATLGTDTQFSGSILADQSVTLDTGADLSGRAFALNAAVTLDGNTITVPVPEPPGTFLLFTGFLGVVVGVRRMRRHFQDSAD